MRKLADFCIRHRRLTVLAWVVALFVTGALAGAAGENFSNDFKLPDSDSTEALNLLEREDFDCLLMDVQMPGMDGVTATRAIRASETLGPKAQVPIIALTAHAMRGDRERFLEAGMNAYLSKPVDFADLARVLGEVLDAKAPA